MTDSQIDGEAPPLRFGVDQPGGCHDFEVFDLDHKELQNEIARYPMGNFGFWTGIGAAEKTAAKSTDGKSIGRRHHVISIVVGIFLALLIAAGLIILFSIVTNKNT